MAAPASGPVVAGRPRAIPMRLIGAGALWLCGFSGFMVLHEPAPYDLLVAVTLTVAFLGGLKITRSIAPLVILIMIYLAGGLLASTQVPQFNRAPMYMATTCFLGASAIFFAAATARSQRMMQATIAGYTAGALLAALAGIAGYFHLFAGAEIFTLYGRAKGTFQDPNVFGPFLLLPASLLGYRVLTQPFARSLRPSALLMVLLAGIFLAFSRATWVLIAFTLAGTFFIVFVNERRSLYRVKLIMLSIFAVMVLILALTAAIHSSAIYTLFEQRAELVQSYDSARLGRFARHVLGFLLAGEKPLGIGPLEFYKTFTEDPHNMYLKSFIAYGWIGGIAWPVLIVWTLRGLFPLIFQPRPTRGIAVAVFVTIVGHAINALVIDMDHWRHMFLLLGLAWGLIAQEKHRQTQAAHDEAGGPALPALCLPAYPLPTHRERAHSRREPVSA